MNKIHLSIAHELKVTMKYLSFEAAVRKVKAARLGRVDNIVDEVVKKLELS